MTGLGRILKASLCVLMLAPLNACGFYGSFHASELARDAQSERTVANSPDVLRWSSDSFNQLEGGVILESPASNRISWGVERVQVLVLSGAEPEGEIVALTETGPDTGVFTASMVFERYYDAAGRPAPRARNGNLTVYAEGDVPAERLVAVHQGLAGKVRAIGAYVEPSSTLTGVFAAADADPGAAVTLAQASGWNASTTVREDGSYAFYEVPPGHFTLRVMGRLGPLTSQVARMP